MLEKEIEKKSNDLAKKYGIQNYKFSSPGHAAVPDRIYLAEIAEEHQEIVAKYIRFIEYKREGQSATPQQEREHTRLRGMGFKVDVIDHPLNAASIFEEMVKP